MERQGVICCSSSNWVSPLHMVKKADGSWRPCGVLGISTCRRSLTDTPVPTWVISLPGWQVPNLLRAGFVEGVPPDSCPLQDVPKTAIVTPFGVFEFIRMAFGLCSAGQTVQHMMDDLLSRLECFFATWTTSWSPVFYWGFFILRPSALLIESNAAVLTDAELLYSLSDCT